MKPSFLFSNKLWKNLMKVFKRVFKSLCSFKNVFLISLHWVYKESKCYSKGNYNPVQNNSKL